jgi:5-keto 4-deoxyuronate isomerase
MTVLDEVVYIYIKKDTFRLMGVVDSLKEYRSVSDKSYSIMCNMHRKLINEIFDGYKESRDDHEIPVIPKGSILIAWKSFSIVSRDVNYFGFGSEEVWLDNVDKLSEKYYADYLIKHQK